MVHLLVIALFVVVLTPGPDYVAPMYERVGPIGATAMVLGALVAIWLPTWWIVAILGRRLARRGDPRSIARADLVVAAARVATVCVVAAGVLGAGWLDAVRAMLSSLAGTTSGDLVALDELIAIAPGLLGLAFGWWVAYPIDRMVREAVMLRDIDRGAGVPAILPRSRWVRQAVRHQLAVVVVPVATIVIWSELVELLLGSADLMVPAVQLVGAAGVFVVMPVVMCRIWDTVPLDTGALRDMLMGLCERAGVRVRGIRVWRTNGMMINGAVIGLIGPLRYILLTDALLDRLESRELQAVMAHEVGHIRLRHMPWLLAAVLGTILLLASVTDAVYQATVGSVEHAAWMELVLVAVVLGAGLVVFGFVSRRFEWQADAYAAASMSLDEDGRSCERVLPQGADAMICALQRVADLNHVPTRRFSWRHGSIAHRQRRLYDLPGSPCRRLPIDRTVGWIKACSGTALLLGVAAMVVSVVGQAS